MERIAAEAAVHAVLNATVSSEQAYDDCNWTEIGRCDWRCAVYVGGD